MRNIHIILILFGFFCLPFAASAQTATLKTDTVSVPCTSSDTFIVPVKILNFTNLGGIQFTLDWDQTQLQYIHIQDFNPLLTNGFVNVDSMTHLANGQLTFAWIDPSGLTIPNTANNTLFNVAFVRLGGAFSPVTFAVAPPTPPTAITLSDPNFNPVPFDISTGGMLTVDGIPPTITCPANVSVMATGPVPVNNIASVTTDNCAIFQTGWSSTGATTASFPNDPDASGTIFNLGETVVTYSTTDVGSNTATCTFTVNVTFDPAASDTLTIIAASGMGDCSTQFFTDITVANFDSIFGVQFSLEWLNTVLEYDSVGMFNSAMNLSIANFNESFTQTGSSPQNGNLSFGWNSDNFVAGTTLANGTVLFRLYFSVVGENGNTSGINFTNFPAGLLSINANLEPVATNYIAGAFVVADEIAPMIVCPASQTVTAVVGQSTAMVTGLDPLSLTDNCSSMVNLTYTPVTVGAGAGTGPANGTFPGGTTVVTYTATDLGGNTATCSFLVTVDVGAIFELRIDSVNYNCSGPGTVSIPFRVFDFANIAGMNFRVQWDETVLQYTGFSNLFPGMTGVSGGSFPSAGTTSLQGYLDFLAVSPSGQWPNIPDTGIVFQLNFNVLNVNATTTFEFVDPLGAIDGSFMAVPYLFTDGFFQSVDITGPTVNCPANIIAPAQTGCSATVNLPSATANDDCGTVASISNNAPAANLFPAGATTVIFTAFDDSGNSNTCSMTVTVNANTALTIPDCPTSPIIIIAVDSCSAPISYPAFTAMNPCVTNANFAYNYNFPNGTVRPVGTTNVVVTATQLGNGGGFVTCNFQVLIVDGGSPQMTCPADLTLETITAECYVVEPFLPEPLITDNCDQNITAVIDVELIDTLNVGTTTLIYYAEDASGNPAACSFNVTVVELLPPVIVCPPSVTVEAAANCQAPSTWDPPAVSDNCSALADINYFADAASGDLFDIGQNVVTFSAVDESGNIGTCTFVITVTETTPPLIAGCPGSIFVVLPLNSCDTVINWTPPTATDNCTLDTLVSDYEPGFSFPSGVTTVTYTAIDIAGNTATCVFLVSAKDEVSPVFVSFPSDITVSNSDPCGAPYSVPPILVSDNCDPNPTFSPDTFPTFFPIGTTTIEVIVMDASGNTTLDTFKITVNSIQVKSFVNIPSNQTLTGCDGVATWTTPNTQGFCEQPVVTANYSSGDTFPVGTTIVTYTATEASGSTITATFSITVVDPEAPVLTCPQPIVVNTAGGIISDPSEFVQSIATANNCTAASLELGGPTATDNCDMTPQVTQIGGGSTGGTLDIGTYTFTYQATDAYGNTSTCAYTVTVVPFAISEPAVDPNPGCEGEMVVLSVPAFTGAAYNWTGPAGPYANSAQITIQNLTAAQTGAYSVVATLNGCMATSTPVAVMMATKPNAENDLNYSVGVGDTLQATSILLNDQFTIASDIQISLLSPLDGLTLNPADGTFTFLSSSAGSFSFVYEICSVACPDLCDMATVTINVRDKNCDFIPNVFTPNGDLINDYLFIPCLDSGLYPNNTIVVYNQWGDKVFEATGYENAGPKAWNGTLNNDPGQLLPDGVYYYIFQQDPAAAALKGFIQLFR